MRQTSTAPSTLRVEMDQWSNLAHCPHGKLAERFRIARLSEFAIQCGTRASLERLVNIWM